MKSLKNHWFLVLASKELKKSPLGVERFGQKWVLWRDDKGQASMAQDWCPHLGARLSSGKVCKGYLQCPFHGLEFNSQGDCVHIPAHGSDKAIPNGYQLKKRVTLREKHGFIWAWMGPVQSEYPQIPFFDELSEMTGAGFAHDWDSHYTRSIENQLDVAHLPFVHKSSIGAGGRTFVQGPLSKIDGNQIKVWVFNEKDRGQSQLSKEELEKRTANRLPMLEFRFPNIWINRISPKMAIFVGFVPVNNEETRLYLYIYQSFVTLPGASHFVNQLLNQFNHYIIKQDQRIVTDQWPRQTSLNTPEKFIGSDAPIIQFRKLRELFLDKSSGLPLESPYKNSLSK